ncbi:MULTISPECIES: cytochrome c biogenesis protein CcsA [Sporosarcina]|uniref:cytochrome c biogenesis protein CcsA n=1 Tax=Sporosarcina TaxID=1569 RepID=UPI00129B4AD2|nr:MULTISPECIES: cytochrome c biogenesis protein CcsA [Sporosarcina]GKV66551.1 protein HemX [Sporosarcina sp. NCCP-2331]GLB56828.1 protein HemX [Sporosarcina sp. NCCP-2378]
MVDLTMARLQEFMIVLYALGLVFYLIDYFKKQKAVQRIAFWLIVAVWVTQTAILTLYIVEMKRFPVLSLVEGIYFYVWLLVTLSIVFQLIYKVNFMVFFMNIIGFIFLMIHVFSNLKYTASTVGDSLVSEVLFIHITTAILSYAVFALAFVFALLYLIVYKVLKKKKFTKQFSSLPNLHQTMMGMKMSIYTGIPILFVSLIFGVQWAYVALTDWSVFDMKIMGSFAVLLFYTGVIFFHYKGKLQPLEFAWMSIFAFLFTVVNFFLGSTLSQFHLWI